MGRLRVPKAVKHDVFEVDAKIKCVKSIGLALRYCLLAQRRWVVRVSDCLPVSSRGYMRTEVFEVQRSYLCLFDLVSCLLSTVAHKPHFEIAR